MTHMTHKIQLSQARLLPFAKIPTGFMGHLGHLKMNDPNDP
jgi:hypothetical protein